LDSLEVGAVDRGSGIDDSSQRQSPPVEQQAVADGLAKQQEPATQQQSPVAGTDSAVWQQLA
jgi:hypothetical protein